jgi:predicted dithiol-disulfide oxidoreductase (DUF899 family)
MKAKSESAITFPKIADQAEWQTSREALLVKEKAATHARDALAAKRRRLPMVKVEKQDAFTGPKGKMSLLDLFEGRRQLMLYHFMFAVNRGLAGCGMRRVLDGDRPIRLPAALPCARYVLLPGLPRTLKEH